MPFINPLAMLPNLPRPLKSHNAEPVADDSTDHNNSSADDSKNETTGGDKDTEVSPTADLLL